MTTRNLLKANVWYMHSLIQGENVEQLKTCKSEDYATKSNSSLASHKTIPFLYTIISYQFVFCNI